LDGQPVQRERWTGFLMDAETIIGSDLISPNPDQWSSIN